MALKDVPKLIYLFLVIVLAPTLLLGARALEYSGDAAAYDASPMCVSTADVSNCKYEGPATVVNTSVDKYSHLWVTVTFDELAGRKVDGIAGDQLASVWRQWKPGDKLDAEMWHGSLTIIAEVRTDTNPHNLASSYGPPSLVFAAATIALIALFVAVKIAVWWRGRAPRRLAAVPPAPRW